MTKHTLPSTDLNVSHLCLGGNVFGWSADLGQSHQVLDAFAELGGNFIDTADVYSEWAPGHIGGESETVLGEWFSSRKNRGENILATKVAMLSTRPGLSKANIIAACDDSLRRLKTDYIDLYYAHKDDPETPLEESLDAFTTLRDAGKIRYAGASNFSGARLLEASTISKANGLIEFAALQNHYNLLVRDDYENDSVPALTQLGIEGVPYFGLARGFLSGKYRPGVSVDSVRAGGVNDYTDDHGWATLEKLDQIAANHGTNVSAVALAWVRQQPTVGVPIASARTVEQLREIMVEVTLTT
ncbi:MAG: aldo/keto reductase, partial [Rhodoluna sp.]